MSEELVEDPRNRLTDAQLRFAHDLIAGKKLTVIAQEMGVSYQTVWNWKRHGAIMEYLADLREEATVQAKTIVAGELVNSAEEIIRLRNNSIHDRIRLDSAKDILDRGGMKPVERVEQKVQHDISPELIRMIQGTMAEARSIPKASLIEVTALPERAGLNG